MRIDLLSSVPDLLSGPLDFSIVGRAKERKLVEIHIHNLRDFSEDKHHKVDDYPYGGGAGMILTPQPVFDAVEHISQQSKPDAVLFPTPDAVPFTQKDANRLSLLNHLVFICGHYKGIDQRIRDELVTAEYSIGDFVVSGGEVPAMLMIDSVVRLLPGALGDAESALTDSFQDQLLDAPMYTRPAVYRGLNVPEVLTSGNHKAVAEWRREKALEKTQRLRPDLLDDF
jgi:tRNA (guanine37-N1)-methyltransferase